MTLTKPKLPAGALAATLVLLLSGCGGESTNRGDVMDVPASPASGEVLGQGTVIQKGSGPVELCLGPMTMIYPPDCGGPKVVGWDWAAVEGAETVASTTWGAYAVQGTWDGARITLTQPPVPLALFDPPALEDARTDPAHAGSTSEAELSRIQGELLERSAPLASFSDNGYLFIEVIHDDGALQQELDAQYGTDVIVVLSQLRPISE